MNIFNNFYEKLPKMTGYSNLLVCKYQLMSNKSVLVLKNFETTALERAVKKFSL